MQVCTAQEIIIQVSTAAECLAFAQTRPDANGVQNQIDLGALTLESTGYCIYNSGGSGRWELVNTQSPTSVCDTSAVCACKPELEYLTMAGTPMANVRIGYDTNFAGEIHTIETCCQLCHMEAPPSAPPTPPYGPSPPDAPPLPPGTPPPPPRPLYPPGTVVQGQAASAIVNLNYQCHGIAISEDGYCYLYSDPRHVAHDGTSSLIQSKQIYYRHAPPPPPLEPQAYVCTAYNQIYDENLMSEYLLPGASQITAVNGESPFECCSSRCDQEPTCQGFSVVRATGLCNFYSTRYSTQTSSVQYGITAYVKHMPPSPPPPSPPPSPPPPSPPPPSATAVATPSKSTSIATSPIATSTLPTASISSTT